MHRTHHYTDLQRRLPTIQVTNSIKDGMEDADHLGMAPPKNDGPETFA